MRHALFVAALTASAAAQSAHRPTPQSPSPSSPNQLPITRIALYKNGVGFFEHAGRVTGDQAVTIDLTSAQLNDVLQSLTAIDLNGGRISGAGYNSTTPLDQQLKTLPLALSGDPSDVDFFNAIRGARVQVTGPGVSIAGRLLAIDLRAAKPRSENEQTPTEQERRFITVVSDTGAVKTLELTSAVTVTLLDTALHTDVTRYLELLAANRSQGLRHLTLLDRGPEGPAGKAPRDLRVSYISEVPVWKSTYRILFTDARAASQTATLQGWSVVDNTTGSDWINVHLDLIAGAPQSFIQPLSTPYYARRPEISLPAEAQLSPQTHESGESLQSASNGIHGIVRDPSGAVIPNAQVVVTNESGAQLTATTSSDGSFSLAVPQPGQYNVQVSMPGFQTFLQRNVFVGPQLTANLDPTLNVGSSSEAIEVNAAPMMASRSQGGLMNGRGAGIAGLARGSANGVLGGTGPGAGGNIGGGALANYDALANASLAPQTTTASFDDFFEYTLTDPISIRKNESALVPILQTRLPVERVTLWSQQQPTALRALWITNSSTLTLDRGSFSIVENGNFGGEGLLDPIHPGERRLLSYAADQAVRITTSAHNNTRKVQRLTINKGVLTETSTDIAELTYDIRNAAPDPRTIILEHPVRNGWTLDTAESDGKPAPKPTETTPTTYRFRITAAPAETAHLHVSERHTNYEYIRLVDRTEDQLLLLLHNAHASPATLAALQPVFDAHHAVVALDGQIHALEAEIATITADQNRLRENMKALKGSPEEKALLTRYTGELNAQEDRLAAINQQLAGLHTRRTAADQDFQTKLNALSLDETL